MQELRLVAVSEDGTYAVLTAPGRSGRFSLPIDERLRIVARGQFSRLAQYEIEVESPLRPKEIQDRIRAGETAEDIADAAGVPIERVRRFEGPVLAERAYRAQEAQGASIRHRATPGQAARWVRSWPSASATSARISKRRNGTPASGPTAAGRCRSSSPPAASPGWPSGCSTRGAGTSARPTTPPPASACPTSAFPRWRRASPGRPRSRRSAAGSARRPPSRKPARRPSRSASPPRRARPPRSRTPGWRAVPSRPRPRSARPGRRRREAGPGARRCRPGTKSCSGLPGSLTSLRLLDHLGEVYRVYALRTSYDRHREHISRRGREQVQGVALLSGWPCSAAAA